MKRGKDLGMYIGKSILVKGDSRILFRRVRSVNEEGR